jgi:N-methylhydantoinase A
VARPGADPVKAKRQVWFRETGVIDATIFDRKRMHAGLKLAGPVVIESLESTILVPPGWQARMDEHGFVLLTRLQQGAGRQ